MTQKELQKTIERLFKFRRGVETLNKALKVFDPDFNFISFGEIEELIVDTLKIAMDDKYDWIGYFLYDLDGKFTKKCIFRDRNGKNLPLRNFNDLYNLIKIKD